MNPRFPCGFQGLHWPWFLRPWIEWFLSPWLLMPRLLLPWFMWFLHPLMWSLFKCPGYTLIAAFPWALATIGVVVLP